MNKTIKQQTKGEVFKRYNGKYCTHRLCGWLTFAFVLGARCGHLLCVAIWNIQQDAGALLTAVRTRQVVKNL